MTTHGSHPKLRVVIVGGGVAALETVLALRELAPEQTATTVIAPNDEFVFRPMTVREPFAYSNSARRYPLARIVHDAGAELLAGELDWVEHDKHVLHTKAGEALEYDALVLALGARAVPRYKHAITIDDRRMDETLHGLIQDIEGGYVDSLAFVSPARMPWQLPLYELALMTAGRAYDMNVDLSTTIITPEDSPLAIFGSTASDALAERLERAHVKTINSAYVEVPSPGEVVINPGDRHLHVKRVIALPELYGPSDPRHPAGRARLHPRRSTRPGAGRGGRLRGRRRDRLPDQARRGRLPAGRRGGTVDRSARRSERRARAVQPRDPRDAADGRRADVPDGEDHRRARIQLGDLGHSDLAFGTEDRREVSRAVPGSA